MSGQIEIHELTRMGRHQDALLLSEKVYAQRPSVETLVTYVQLLVNQNFYERAEEVLQKSGFSPAKSQNVYFLYCELYEKAGKVDELAQIHKLQENGLEPHLVQAWTTPSPRSAGLSLDRQYFCRQLGDLLDNLECELWDPGDLSGQISLLVESGKVEKAQTLIRKLADKQLDKTVGYFLRSELNLVRGEFGTAEKRFTKLLGKFSRPALVRNRLGDICLVTGRRIEALEHYQEAARIDPDDLDTWRDQIRAHALNGEYTRARRKYLEARGVFGDQAVADLHEALIHVPVANGCEVVNGLAWYEGGGGVLPIEVSWGLGDGKLCPSGNLGIAMLDSITVAYGYTKDRLSGEGFDLSTGDMQVNVPEAVVYKDGPSAGLAFAVGMLSQATGRKVDRKSAFTGEISLSGTIQPVGGIPGKLAAAYLGGLQRVFMPAKNLSDLAHVSMSVKKSLEIVLVRQVEEVWSSLWP